MKSLILLTESTVNIPESNLISSKICYDPISKITYLAALLDFGACAIYSIEENKNVTEISNFPINYEASLEILSVKFLIDNESLCLCLSNGDIYSVNLTNPEIAESIGSIDNGLLAVSWSPDEEIFAMFTGDEKLILMTKDFEVLSEKYIQADEEEEETYVNVGWGKKETQFHGSLGKNAAKETVNYSAFTLSEDDNLKPSISWRGDGNFLVCSLIDNSTKLRTLKVYNREGALQNNSELVDKLEHGLSWKPSGSVIASTQRLPHRYQVVFFERNGLRHGEFTLPSDVNKVLELKWNSDSSILALAVSKTCNNITKTHLQLWYMNNYFWYLKYDIPLPTIDTNSSFDFIFDPEFPLNLSVVLNGSQVRMFNFNWENLTSHNLSKDCSLMVAVINGIELYLTPFRFRNIPPPMSAFQPKFNNSIQHVSFSNFDNGNQIAVLDICQNFYTVKFDIITQKKITPPKIQKLNLQDKHEDSSSISYRQICYSGENTIYALGYCNSTYQDVISKISIDNDDQTAKVIDTFATKFPIIQIINQEGSIDPLVQLNDGKIYYVKSNDGIIELEFALVLNERCEQVQVIKYDEYSELKVAALSQRNRLYLNRELINSNCTSFSLHNEYLVYSTSDHVARFFPLYANLREISIEDLTRELEPYSRNLERGSKIVLVAPHDVSLVLQMPRGNLETVYPRALVLSSVREALKSKNYGTALVQCRRNRIDLNVLFDENPDIFLEDIQIFVDQVDNPDYLNLFISDLKEENIINTKYPKSAIDGNNEPTAQSVYPDKVNTICKSIRDAMLQKDKDKFIQSIVTTYARQLPADLESILSLLKELKEQDADFAEKTLKYAIFLTDINQLFDVALGMYDFSLVLMVAQHSQKDPKEYLPYLSELDKLSPDYRKFRIDRDLKRVDKALIHIINSGDEHFEECLKFIKEHNLYKEALCNYPTKTESYKIIMSAYASYLHSIKKYQDAGTAYLSINDYESALPSLLKIGNWQLALICAQKLNFEENKTLKVIEELIEYLKQHNRHIEAAKLIDTYIKNPEEATACLLEGHHWLDAIFNCEFSSRKDLIEADVIPSILSNLEQVKEDIADMSEQFSKQRVRVHELQNLPPPTIPDYDGPGMENIEIQSDATSAFNYTVYTRASTNFSTLTGGSTKTGKSRRKLERKKNQGKKGSIFEYDYLLGSISRLVDRSNNMQNDIKALLIGLSSLNLNNEAKALQNQFEVFLLDLNKDLDWIYQPAKPKTNLELLIAKSKGHDGNPIEIMKKPTLELNGKWKLAIY